MQKPLPAAIVFALSMAHFANADTPKTFDVAEGHTRIFMSDTPVRPSGHPAHGNAFTSQVSPPPTRGTLTDGSSLEWDSGFPVGPVEEDKLLPAT